MQTICSFACVTFGFFGMEWMGKEEDPIYTNFMGIDINMVIFYVQFFFLEMNDLLWNLDEIKSYRTKAIYYINGRIYIKHLKSIWEIDCLKSLS